MDTTKSIPTAWVQPADDVLALPQLTGYGNVYSLRQAMARDSSGGLKALVEQFAQTTTRTERDKVMEKILFKWTGVEGVDPKGRTAMAGMDFDSRKLAVLEAFMGREFVQINSEIGPTKDPLVEAVPVLMTAYDNLYERMYSKLMAQTHLKSIYDKVVVQRDASGTLLRYDLSGAISELGVQIQQNQTAGIQTLKEVSRTLFGSGKYTAYVDYNGFINAVSGFGSAAKMAVDEEVSDHYPSLVLFGETTPVDFTGLIGKDQLYGSEFDDQLHGVAGDDFLMGNGGNDYVDGGEGNDTLSGGAGNDIYVGGTGNDVMDDSSGSDTYYFGWGDGNDEITDFDSSNTGDPTQVDTVTFRAGIKAEEVILSRTESDLILRLGNSDSVIVRNHFAWPAYRIEKVAF